MTQDTRPGSYLQIGDAAERTQLTQRTLRYYEEKGLLKPPTRMEGGFRLYSPEDLERIERIKQFKDLLGFSLAEIREMLEAEELKMQIRAEWRTDADAAEKAQKVRAAREVTLQQLALLEQKMQGMTEMRDHLAERMAKYDAWLLQWSGEGSPAEAAQS